MPRIIPIKDLKDTSSIINMCEESDEPIFVTRNGYGEFVIMNMRAYDAFADMHDLHRKLDEGIQDIQEGRVIDAEMAMRERKAKYGLQN